MLLYLPIQFYGSTEVDEPKGSHVVKDAITKLKVCTWSLSEVYTRALYRGVCHTKILDFRAPLYSKIAIQYTKYRFHFTIYWQTLIPSRASG